MMLIYIITNNINGKHYIGQTVQTMHGRWRGHMKALRNGRKLPLYNAFRKYGIDNFEIKLIASVDSHSKEEAINWLNILEPLFIIAFNSTYPNGYNLDGGGKNHASHPTTKAKIGLANKGNKNFLGKRHSPETIARFKEIAKNRTAEHKAKIGATKIGNKYCVGRIVSPDSRIKSSLSNIETWKKRKTGGKTR